MSSSNRIVAYVPDLIDRSRLAGASEEVDIRFVRKVDELVKVDGDVDLVIVDLSREGVLEVVPKIKPRVVGFGPHIDRATLTAAQKAGCDEVVVRSAFFADLGRWMTKADQPVGPDGCE